MMRKHTLTLLSFLLTMAAVAQQGNSLTAKDYERAESQMGYNTEPLVDNHFSGRPGWLSGDRFWYRILTARGSEFILVDPAKKTRAAAFDQQKLAAALSTATGKQYGAYMLPFQTFVFSTDERAIVFKANGKTWSCDLTSYACAPDTTTPAAPARGEGRRGRSNDEVLSPDGSKAAFIKEYNLWVREVKTGRQTQLTTDGIRDFGYATDNAGWQTSDGAVLSWSPDSRKIASASCGIGSVFRN